jgi:hypothetical protein
MSIKKICRVCLEEKDNELFVKDRIGISGTKTICKECANKNRHEYYVKNVEKIRNSAKQYRNANKEKIKLLKKKWQQSEKSKKYQKVYNARPETKVRFRRLQWKRKYGLSPQGADFMLASQNHSCAICGVHLDKPYLDHCHKTNEISGFLCELCNIGLGAFKDNPTFLSNAITYLVNKRITRTGKIV